ncbi:hypothetical protein [Ekhidna sp.]|uniref:hypothetical protein n=1 Tax=Ekhidna sp. TaxID=2608089 RepID=UPI003B5A1EC1
MKKFILILSIVAICWATGCKDDDDSGSFVGTWIGQTKTVSCKDPSKSIPTAGLRCDDSCYRLTLEGNGDFTYQQGFSEQSGFWELDGRLKLCQDEEGETICEEYDAQVAQGALTLVTDSTSAGCVSTFLFFKEEPADTTSNDG